MDQVLCGLFITILIFYFFQIISSHLAPPGIEKFRSAYKVKGVSRVLSFLQTDQFPYFVIKSSVNHTL